MCVANNERKTLNATTIKANTAQEAEEAAVALAGTTVQMLDEIVVPSDSQTACRHNLLGRLNKKARNFLIGARGNLPHVHVVWTPGHASPKGNEITHTTA
ncbi:hypothetical protein HPB50_003384 [Hyalomma asiaticum]|uniref:Uncharacterized protein n=1 Tax=Hyalomma asiaticum TaxID=266040 RepID=A0ACB7TC36_HYAAI|nr:hypothetical protein HPB50_003384 [Hyalomma asiaticum]